MKNSFTFHKDQPLIASYEAPPSRIKSSMIFNTLFLLVASMLMSMQLWAASYYSHGNQDPTVLTNWWSNTNGTGTHPANFSNGDIFNIQNGHTMTSTAIWTVAGTNAEIIINGGGTFIAALSVTTQKLTINASGIMNISSGSTIKVKNGSATTDLTVLGTLINSGILTLVSPATASFGNGSTYRHSRDGGAVPLATWDPGSTCEFTGITTTEPTGISGQSFGNFTWNCTHTKNIQLAGNLTTVAGNFTVMGTGSFPLILTSTVNLTLTIGGNFSVSGGTVNFANGAAATKILNIGGNYTQTGGTFTNGNSVLLNINFAGVSKTFSFSAGTLTNNNINWTVLSGASLTLLSNLPVAVTRSCTVNGTLNCGILYVFGSGGFTLANGATLVMGSPWGINSVSSPRTGNVQVTGTRSFSSLANYTYVASSGSPVTGDDLPATINNFTVSMTSATPLTISRSVLTVSGNMSISSGKLELGAGKQLTVSGTTTLTGSDCFVLKSDATGSASFVNTGTISGSGTAKVERYIANNWDWHLLSSPVIAQPIWNSSTKSFAPVPGAGNSWASQTWNWDLYRWAPQGDPNGYTPYPWVNLRNTTGIFNNGSYTIAPYGFGSAIPTFLPGTGYLVAYASDYGLTTPFFEGNLNSGTLSVPLVVGSGINSNGQSYTNNLNLIGNPYPSSLDFNLVSSGNPTVLSSAGYWVMMGDGTYAAYDVSSGGTGGASRYIAPMQGYEVTAARSTNLSITNAMRVHATQSWLKESDTYTNRLSLKIHNDGNNLSDEIIVHFDPSFSPEGGAIKMFSMATAAPNLYTVKNNTKYTINQLPSAGSANDIPLCLVPGISTQYTLEASGIDGFDNNTPIFLTDLTTGTITDLKKDASYTFTSATGDNPNRFVLSFGVPNSVQTPIIKQSIGIFASNRNIYVENNSGIREFQLCVYDLQGSMLMQKSFAGNSVHYEMPMETGMYIVKVISMNGNASQKVFIR